MERSSEPTGNSLTSHTEGGLRPRPFDPRAMPAHTVVVGVDGSPGSKLALRWSLAAADRHGTQVDAVMVWTDAFAPFGPPTDISALSPEHQRQLLGRVESAINSAQKNYVGPPVRVRPHVLPGSPASVLVASARRADLLVLGSRGLGGIRGSLLGSVSQECAQLAPGPVVVVRDNLPAGAEHYTRNRRIVVGIDGSEASRAALRWAGAEAQRAGVELEVVHAWGSPNARLGVVEGEDGLRRLGQAILDDALEPLKESGCLYSQHLASGAADAVLVDRSSSADLLVVSSRGRGGLPALLLGSVSQQCLIHAKCPVAVIHA